jgi:Tfp pilus assembly protein PilX
MNASGRKFSKDERGIALVMAMMILTVLSLIAVVLMMSVLTETKLTGHNLRTSTALNYAEAGITEAKGRLVAGDIALGANPKAVVAVFNTTSGTVPTFSVDTTGIATAQPSGAWLAYSTATKGPDMLTVSYKTDAARTVIYKYDDAKNPPIQTVSGMPIYVIRSTGKSGTDVRKLVTEIYQNPVTLNIKGAVVSSQANSWSGNDYMCGYNHRVDTPTNKGNNGRAGAGGCNENPGAGQWETGIGNLPGLWSTSTIAGPGPYVAGSPTTAPSQPSFYAGPWEAVGMTQAQFFAWIGPKKTTAPVVPLGLVYLDNNSTPGDQSGSFSFSGGDGEGMLYVDGDLTLNGNFHYRGMIYVEGNLFINSWSWILGSVIVRGKSAMSWHSNGTILYSSDAVVQKLSKYSGQYTTLSWREL